VATQVFVRYVVQKPWFLWSEEAARFVLVWLVFLGIGMGIKQGTHFAMDLLPNLLGGQLARVLRLAADLSMGLVLVLLTLAGLRFCYVGLAQKSPTMEISMLWIFAALPSGGFLGLVYLGGKLLGRGGGERAP
jgi:C4-dicarboxylate transporter DctQ subunit